jgi:hypothetical protein
MSIVPGEARDARIKGSSMRELVLWYERRLGRDATLAIVADLPPEFERLVTRTRPALGILASTWYPSAFASHMCDRVIAGLPDEGRAMAREANRDIVPMMIRGIYKALWQTLASPELYARHVDRHWHKLHTTGERSFVIRAPGEALSVVRSWDGHHPLLCWMMIYTMVSLFEAMRLTEVTADRIRCVAHGADECATILRWK